VGRFTISPERRVGALRGIPDRVFAAQDGHGGWSRSRLIAVLDGVSFPAAEAATHVTLPLRLGALT
jgi:hypothetical protein